MAYLIRTLGWTDKDVLLFAFAHILLIGWALALILNTKSIDLIVLVLNYSLIFLLSSILTKYSKNFAKKSNELD